MWSPFPTAMFPSEDNVVSYSDAGPEIRDCTAEAANATSIVATLNAFLESASPSGCIGAVRAINPGDEQFLTAREAVDRAVLSVQRSSGAGRFLARQLCARLGRPISEIPRSALRYPMWPAGLVGSISHDPLFAAAVVGSTTSIAGIGIDIEAAEPLSPEVAALIGHREEIQSFSEFEFGAKAVFSIKEAVFKAVYPNDGVFLEFGDVLIDRHRGVARTAYGRVVHWRLCTGSRVLAISWY